VPAAEIQTSDPSVVAPTSQDNPPMNVTAPSESPVPAKPSPAAKSSPKEIALASPSSTTRAPGSTARVVSDPKPKRNVPARRPTEADPKKDSKFGSFLKKTGRILKKPFEQ
jgi:hypothetical protein